tara:strand:- start:1805 stop:1948 length:144 start_codon:yes stop_codon:yes gene_type:complete
LIISTYKILDVAINVIRIKMEKKPGTFAINVILIGEKITITVLFAEE